MSEIVNDIKSAVDAVKVDLPSDLTRDPVVTELRSTEFPILSVFFTGDVSNDVLHNLYDDFEADVKNISGVSKVSKTGYLDREVQVEVDPKKLQEYYDLEIGDVMRAIQVRNISQPGGLVTFKGEEYLIRTLGEYQDVREIKNTIIRANAFGRLLRVSDVASGYASALKSAKRSSR